MGHQLPAGAGKVAAGVLVWSFTCLAANSLLIWLLWTIHERRSYIFIVSSVALLATVSSIVQQLYDIVHYEDMMYARLAWVKANAENAMVIATDGTAPGVDLTMWSIRWGCYIAECGTAFFWAFSLCVSVYGWRDNSKYDQKLKLVAEFGKPFSILITIFTMAILQLSALQESHFWWNFVLNFFYCFFCAGGLFFFFLIFVEYFLTRLLFRRMNSQQITEWERQPSRTGFHGRTSSNAASMVTMTQDESFGALAQQKGGIYDKFLMARTFLPVLALSVFEVNNILVNARHHDSVQQLARTAAPDLTTATAQGHFTSFIPGCLASLFLFVAFGTTRSCRDQLYQLVVPARWQSAARRARYQAEHQYRAMDSDNGILSRHKRLSMEKHLLIEVTYEFEIRNESIEGLEAEAKSGSSQGDYGAGGAVAGWDDAATILPARPPTSVLKF